MSKGPKRETLTNNTISTKKKIVLVEMFFWSNCSPWDHYSSPSPLLVDFLDLDIFLTSRSIFDTGWGQRSKGSAMGQTYILDQPNHAKRKTQNKTKMFLTYINITS